jgi:hypothetical protein
MANTKEQIQAAAKKKFKTENVDLGDGIKITLRELTRKDRDALDTRIFKRKADGSLEVAEGCYVPVPGSHFNEEWIAATATPALTVEDLLADDWPDSLKAELRLTAQKINGVTVAEAAKN